MLGLVTTPVSPKRDENVLGFGRDAMIRIKKPLSQSHKDTEVL